MLNLHQPAGNLDKLLSEHECEAKEILWALDRIPRSLSAYEDLGRVHLSLSGTLLETLRRHALSATRLGDRGLRLACLAPAEHPEMIEVLGSAYYHLVLPLMLPDHREEQIGRWLGIGRHLFWRNRSRSYWSPELGFCMQLVPPLARQGFEWVIVD